MCVIEFTEQQTTSFWFVSHGDSHLWIKRSLTWIIRWDKGVTDRHGMLSYNHKRRTLYIMECYSIMVYLESFALSSPKCSINNSQPRWDDKTFFKSSIRYHISLSKVKRTKNWSIFAITKFISLIFLYFWF